MALGGDRGSICNESLDPCFLLSCWLLSSLGETNCKRNQNDQSKTKIHNQRNKSTERRVGIKSICRAADSNCRVV